MSDPLFIEIKYNIKNDSFETNSNIKEEKIVEIVLEYLRTQIGLGKDDRTAADKDIYSLRLELDLSEDHFKLAHDTNNMSLSMGILTHFIQTKGKK
jgi:hypothetical protein